MVSCPSCHSENPQTSKFCSDCGAALQPELAATIAHAASASPSEDEVESSNSSHHGRFLPGTKVANRYRIVSLVGKGGMGEVYRADDLKLGHTVALKFLPKDFAKDPQRLDYFYTEVRLTRQISHPNVCRVYDIGEVDGQHFLSMEYIDGEDLRILLRQIGRLPRDKGVQIAQQLCAGLAAAHDKGVLHRDLKPANIMIDGHGHIRITDFGLATLADDQQQTEVVGTPAYMAPEQLERGETTIQSDLYSLGLILYELFTAERPLESGSLEDLRRLHLQSSVSRPSELIDDMDPTVERAIMRCLEREPQRRPASARAVAAALPGGDPLAAAVAAGETPSPEMVAAAGTKEGLRPVAAIACLVTMIIGIILVLMLRDKCMLIGRVGVDLPPAALMVKARETIEELGYTEPFMDFAYSFADDSDYLQHIEANDPTTHRWDRLSVKPPSAIYFWYRQSSRPFIPSNIHPTPFIIEPARVWEHEPSPLLPGNVTVRLDPDGKLRKFIVVPPSRDPADSSSRADSSGTGPLVDWPRIFEAAALDMADFVATGSEWVPPVNTTQRVAWVPDATIENLTWIDRVEAATFRDRVVFFEVISSWTRPFEPQVYRGFQISNVVRTCAYTMLTMLIAVLLAPRNLRLKRSDRKGAARISIFVIAMWILAWVLMSSHSLSVMEFRSLVDGLAVALFWGALVWLYYIALEPFVRRLWPKSLTTWTRLINGRVADPTVGRDILVGAAAGPVLWLLWRSPQVVPVWFGMPAQAPFSDYWILDSLADGKYWLGIAGVNLLYEIRNVFVWGLMPLLLYRVILRRQWLACAAYLVIESLLLNTLDPIAVICRLGGIAVILLLLVRLGALATISCTYVHAFFNMPISMDVHAWYVERGWLALAMVLAIALYGFFTSLGGRKLIRDVLPAN